MSERFIDLVIGSPLTLILVAAATALMAFYIPLNLAYGAAPTPGTWTLVQGTSPTSTSASTLTVGTVNSQGNLVNWHLGNFILQGTYNSVTGKIIFSTKIGGKTKTWTGYHFTKTPCNGGDILRFICIHNMAGTYTYAGTNGWYATKYTSIT